MSSSSSSAGEKHKGVGKREVASVASGGSKPRTRSSTRGDRFVRSPTGSILGDHFHGPGEAGSDLGAGTVLPKEVRVTRGGRRSVGEEGHVSSPIERRDEPIRVACERDR